ncbi:type I restriction enzyme specificity protein [Burkholderia pseudomallei]|nr:type I restriction enzyme specificity protein [Burkholderia pseudomallei]CAK0276248.1 type I restriction enzyme specificity protein [Burkholderia pseudomallei]
MGNWRRSTWGQEISLEYGKALRGYTSAGGSVRVFGTNGPVGWTDAPLAEGPGVILGRKGAYRGVHYSPAPFFVIDTAYYAVPKTDLDMRWLYYAMIYHQLGQIDDGSPIPSTTRAAVYPRELEVPNISEQRAIAAVLSALDDKCQHNQRTAKAMELLTRAIFRAWFVSFEPVKAKASGATSFPSMPKSIFDTLPTRFVDSEVGPLPEGWEVKPIGDVVSVKGGATPSTKNQEYWENGTHCWATPKDMSRLSHPVLLDTERYITDAGVECVSSGLLPVGTVLMSSRAPVGYLAIAGVPTAINQGFIAMVCDGPLPPTYVLQWAHASMDAIHARATGTTFPEISKKNFRPLPVVVPPQNVVNAFRDLVDPFFELLTANIKESGALTTTRDYLLPRLVGGSVSVEVANG